MQRAYAVRSETNGRDHNEDSYLVRTAGNATLLVVADGMGGLAGGEHASAAVVEAVATTITARGGRRQSDDVLVTSAVAAANERVHALAREGGWNAMGSTVLVALIRGDLATVANLGDSPLYHLPANGGPLTKVTRDHNVAELLLGAGLIEPGEVRDHAGRSQLQFYAGAADRPQEQPLYHVRLAAGDRLLLCSDGISGRLEAAQIAGLLSQQGGELEAQADALLRVARDSGETDNQTLILWRHGAARTAARRALRLTALAMGAATLAAAATFAVAWRGELRAVAGHGAAVRPATMTPAVARPNEAGFTPAATGVAATVPAATVAASPSPNDAATPAAMPSPSGTTIVITTPHVHLPLPGGH